jgi:hypothetical protein
MSDETISKTSSESSLVKIDLEIKQEEPKEIKETKSEKMERDSIKCSKITFSICKSCIGCWRCCLNSCEVVMDCNIRCCTCTKNCLERIDCDETH